jgi:heterotetrameric sarcosine oxidase gamma subunit
VPEYIAKTALEGRAPLDIGGTVLMELDVGAIASIQPYPSQDKAVAKVLKPLGFTFPAVNSFAAREGALIVWSGREQALLIGAECPDFGSAAAVTDQSGAWVTLSLAGPAAEAVLARYVPMDLRLQAFPVGAAARTPLYHMSMVLLREAEDGFRLMLFRSMARTAWHEIEVALKTLAARAA